MNEALLSPATSLRRLIAQLQLAYSGELAAALAYRGHAASVRDRDEKARIRTIEEEEWHHRELVGGILVSLGAKPRLIREIRGFLIGETLRIGCHLAGWFLPMYGAGKLESRNVKEYEDAAIYAIRSGRAEMLECLLTMAEVEWEHEHYFRSKVAGHAMLRWFPLWPAMPPKHSIRKAYQSDEAYVSSIVEV